jgi:hypothetical protein
MWSGDVKVLSFAAVGFHGREWRARAVSHAPLILFLAVLFSADSALGQPRPADLAARIAAVVTPPEPIALSSLDADSQLRADVGRALRERGYSLVDSGGVPVRLTCGRNLRDEVCAAEIEWRGSRQTVVVTNPRVVGGDATSAEPNVALRLRSAVVQRDPVLDVAAAGDDLIVLEPTRVRLLHRQSAADANPAQVASAPIATMRVMPRDVRGRVQVTGGGFEALLPGVTCRGVVKPFAVSCADESGPWPLGIENTGLVANRNHFTTPEGLGFFGAARIGRDAPIDWLVADQRGALMFLDGRRASVARAGSADDVVRLEEPCAAGVYLVTTSPAAGERDADDLHLLRLAGRTLVAVATFHAPGVVTALWAEPGSAHATAIVRAAPAPRYEAFDVSLSCVR